MANQLSWNLVGTEKLSVPSAGQQLGSRLVREQAESRQRKQGLLTRLKTSAEGLLQQQGKQGLLERLATMTLPSGHHPQKSPG